MVKHEFSYLKDRFPSVKRIAISAGASGDNTIVSAVTGKIIRVYQLLVVSSGTVNARFESGAGGTALTGQMPLIASTGFATSWCPVGHFETLEGQLLNLELSGAVPVAGWLVYSVV